MTASEDCFRSQGSVYDDVKAIPSVGRLDRRVQTGPATMSASKPMRSVAGSPLYAARRRA